MEEWASIKYRDFYDVPRIFLRQAGDRLLLFDCRFNEERDQYEEAYKVFLMPKLPDEETPGSWEHLSAKAESLLGEVRTSDVEFDPTRRKQVKLEVLNKIQDK